MLASSFRQGQRNIVFRFIPPTDPIASEEKDADRPGARLESGAGGISRRDGFAELTPRDLVT